MSPTTAGCVFCGSNDYGPAGVGIVTNPAQLRPLACPTCLYWLPALIKDLSDRVAALEAQLAAQPPVVVRADGA